jgi:hypothetical protein
MERRSRSERGEASEPADRIDVRSVREFLRRGWAESEALEREHWARRHREEGPKATLDAAGALFEHVRRLRPDWPREEERAADLAHHVAWRRLLETIARGLAAR